MSPDELVTCDEATRMRRTTHVTSATYGDENVACLLVASDMGARACRRTQSSGTTLTPVHVASPNRPERHGRQCMSPHAVFRSDMGDRASHATRSWEATFID